LTRIRLGLFERDLAHRHGVSVATVSDILVTWVNYLYIMPGSLPIWVPEDKIKKYLPEGFKGQYQDIRGIFDCTEIKCDMPKDKHILKCTLITNPTIHIKAFFALLPTVG